MLRVLTPEWGMISAAFRKCCFVVGFGASPSKLWIVLVDLIGGTAPSERTGPRSVSLL
jgi:hypothetical protein